MNIKTATVWLTTVATGAIMSAASAFAADMPVRAPVAPIASYDWSGVYLGAHAGYGGGMKDWENLGDFVARGPLVGGQVGVNKQLASFVFGLELDGSWADIEGSRTLLFGGAPIDRSSTQVFASKIDGLATIAARAGLAADRWFVFAKAGLTLGHERHSSIASGFVGALGAAGVVTTSQSAEDIRLVPMLGFGAEYALGGNWSIVGEYNMHYFDAKASTLGGTATTGGVTVPLVFEQRIEEVIHVAKLGVNYRFGGIAVDPSFTPVPPAPGTNWSGGYIGVQGGYGWGHKEWPVVFVTLPPPRYDMKGWLAGGTIGANAQAGSFVFGVEGEILGTDIKGSQTATGTIPGFSFTQTLDSKIDWLALATARAGFVVGDRLLLYGKGGVAIAEEKHAVLLTRTPNLSLSLAGKAVHTGVVLGAGGEYALAPNWSVKLEYDYVRMFAQPITTPGTGTNFGAPGTIDADSTFNRLNQDLHLVKFGVNYHFNPLPVVVSARY
jgi:outer membrane immunogenic protein